MIRLLEGVHMWSRFNEEKKYNFNGFILAAGGESVAVDPPPLDADDRGFLAAVGLKPALLVITNRNHLRAREELQALSPCPLALHRDEAGQVDVAADKLLADGDHLPAGLKVVHLPGKSPGEIGLHWPKRRILLLGDALIAPRGELKLIPEAKLDDPARLRASLQRLKRLDFDHLLMADGDCLLGGAKAKVEAFLETLG